MNDMGGACSTHGGRKEVNTGLWWVNLRERDHLEVPGVDGSLILQWMFVKRDGGMTGLIWLRLGTGGGLL